MALQARGYNISSNRITKEENYSTAFGVTSVGVE